MLPENSFAGLVCLFFYAFEIKEETQGRVHEGRRKQGGHWSTGQLISLMCSLEDGYTYFKSILILDAQIQWTGLV